MSLDFNVVSLVFNRGVSSSSVWLEKIKNPAILVLNSRYCFERISTTTVSLFKRLHFVDGIPVFENSFLFMKSFSLHIFSYAIIRVRFRV